MTFFEDTWNNFLEAKRIASLVETERFKTAYNLATKEEKEEIHNNIRSQQKLKKLMLKILRRDLQHLPKYKLFEEAAHYKITKYYHMSREHLIWEIEKCRKSLSANSEQS